MFTKELLEARGSSLAGVSFDDEWRHSHIQVVYQIVHKLFTNTFKLFTNTIKSSCVVQQSSFL